MSLHLRQLITKFHSLPLERQKSILVNKVRSEISEYLKMKTQEKYKTLENEATYGIKYVTILDDFDQHKLSEIIETRIITPHKITDVEIFKKNIFEDFIEKTNKTDNYDVPLKLHKPIESLHLKYGRSFNNFYFDLHFD